MAQRKPKDDVDGGWAWVVLLGSFLTFCLSGGFSYTNGVFFVSMLRHFGHSHAYTSWMISLATSFFQIAGPVACGLIPRLGCRGAMVVGAVVMSTGYIMSAFASSFLTVLVSYGVIMAVGQCFTYCSTIVVLNEYFVSLHALATSVAMTGNGVGTFVMGHLLEYLTTTRGWRETFIACAAMSLQLCVVGFCFFPIRRKSTNDFSDKKKNKPNGNAYDQNGTIQFKAIKSKRPDESHNGYAKCASRHQQIGVTIHPENNVNDGVEATKSVEAFSKKLYNHSAVQNSCPRIELLESLVNNRGSDQIPPEKNTAHGKRLEETTMENGLNKTKPELGWQLTHITGNVLARWDSRDFMATACLAQSCALRRPPRSPLLRAPLHVPGNPHSFCTLSMLPKTKLLPVGSQHDLKNKHTLHQDDLLKQSFVTRSCKNFMDVRVPTEGLIVPDRQSKDTHNMNVVLKWDCSLNDLHRWDTAESNDKGVHLPKSTHAQLDPGNADDCLASEASRSVFEKRKLFPDWDEEISEVEYEDPNSRWPKAKAEQTGLLGCFKKANGMFRLPRYHPHVWCLGVSTMLVQMAASTNYGLGKDMLMSAGVGEAYPTMLSIMGIVDLLSRLATGLLCTLQVMDVTVLYMMSMVGVSISLLLYAALLHYRATAVALFYLLSAVFALCYSSSNVLLAIVPARRFGREQLAQIFGVQLFWCGVGAFMGPIIGGFLVDTVNSYSIVQVFTAACAAAGAGCTLIVICTSAPAVVSSNASTPEQPECLPCDMEDSSA